MIEKRSSDAHIRANSKYNKANTKSVALRFNLRTDNDILERLGKVPSKMGYIKDLIRKDIKENPL